MLGRRLVFAGLVEAGLHYFQQGEMVCKYAARVRSRVRAQVLICTCVDFTRVKYISATEWVFAH